MTRAGSHPSDSQMSTGGRIAGARPDHAYVLSGPVPSAIPIVLAVPHAGRAYPDSLLGRMRNPDFTALRLEDRHVDKLAEAVARETGAMLLVARAPRAMIDLNRAPDDVDWGMFARPHGGDADSYAPGQRARTGLGLIPRRIPGLGELWKRPHYRAELEQRIAGIHEPYHAALAAAIEALRARWGAALLLDLHSMPPLARRGTMAAPEFVLGDRFGASCHGRLVAHAFSHFDEHRRLAAHNRPYAGGFVLERHAMPGAGLHAMQVEIDRSSYLDSQLRELGGGFDSVIAVLSGLVIRLAVEVAALGRDASAHGLPEAAE